MNRDQLALAAMAAFSYVDHNIAECALISISYDIADAILKQKPNVITGAYELARQDPNNDWNRSARDGTAPSR